jgi:hypothetical protein
LERITQRLDQIDSAAALVASVAQAQEWNSRYVSLQRARANAMPSMGGVFTVTRAFDYLGAHFEVGMLVDQSLLGLGRLHRGWLGKELQPVEGVAVAA